MNNKIYFSVLSGGWRRLDWKPSNN